ncbi:MAG: hypothetical protein NTZ59_13540 [Bacteroidetes bacterium]|nr:hypothetical protein [Bacteroidota bacterium]
MQVSINPKKNFEVKRASASVLLKAFLCFVWGILLATSFAQSGFSYFPVLVFFIVLSILIVAKKDKNASMFIEIDKQGIWVHNQLLTDWNNYITSFITKEYIGENNTEKLTINLEYYKDGENGFFLNHLHFDGNEDKTEYEVMDAIQYYYKHRQS